MNMMVVRGPSKKVANKCISPKQENALEQDSRGLWWVVGTLYVLGNLMQGAPVSDSCCSLPHHACRHMTFSADDHVSWKAWKLHLTTYLICFIRSVSRVVLLCGSWWLRSLRLVTSHMHLRILSDLKAVCGLSGGKAIAEVHGSCSQRGLGGWQGRGRKSLGLKSECLNEASICHQQWWVLVDTDTFGGTWYMLGTLWYIIYISCRLLSFLFF